MHFSIAFMIPSRPPSPNGDYLFSDSTALLLNITVHVAVTWTAFTMGVMICKATGDNAIRQWLKAAFVYSVSPRLGVCCRVQAVNRAAYSLSTSIQCATFAARASFICADVHLSFSKNFSLSNSCMRVKSMNCSGLALAAFGKVLNSSSTTRTSLSVGNGRGWINRSAY